MNKRIVRWLLLPLTVFLTLLPLLYIILVSIESKETYYTEILSFNWKDWTIENYVLMMRNFGIGLKLWNTFIVTVGSVFFILALAIPFAYALMWLKRKFRLFLMAILLIFSFIPEQVTILSKYQYFVGIGLVDSQFIVILLLVSQHLSFVTLMLTFLFLSTPKSLYWALDIDGASEYKKMIHLTIPVSRNGILVQVIWLIVSCWNSLLIPMVFLHSDKIKMVMPAIAALDRRYGTNIPFQMAGLVLSSIPILLLYAGFHKKIVQHLDIGV